MSHYALPQRLFKLLPIAVLFDDKVQGVTQVDGERRAESWWVGRGQ